MDMQAYRRYRAHVADVLRQQGNKVIDRLVFDHLWQLVDDDTLTAGIKSSVSYARMAAEMSETMTRGKRNRLVIFGRDDAINAVQRLVDAGLLLRLSKSREDNLAVKFVKNEVTTKLPPSYHQEILTNQSGYASQEPEGYGEVTTYLPSFHKTMRPEQSVDAARFAMHSDWMPSEVFKARVNEAWKPNEAQARALKAKLFGFVAYWQTKAVQFSQIEWELKLWRNDFEKLLTAPPDFMAVINGNVTCINKARKSKSLTPALTVPEKLWGKVLQDWGLRNGFRACLPGEEDSQYRAFLRNECERRNLREERDAMQGDK